MATISKRGRKTHKPGRQPKTLDQLKRLYERQKDRIAEITLTDKSGEVEQWKHCLDTKSFEGKRYCPQYVVSSFGRVWDLDKGKDGELKKLTGNRSKRDTVEGYLKINVPQSGNARAINPNRNVYVHELVANYFCDLDHEQRTLMIEKGRAKNENDFAVHHISLNRLGGTFVNKWDNLQYLGKIYHKAIHDLLKANISKNEEIRQKRNRSFKKKYGALTEDPLMSALLNAYASGTHKDNKLSITYKRLSNEEIEKERLRLNLPEHMDVDPISETVFTSQRFEKRPENVVEPQTTPLRKSVGLEPLDADKQSDTQQEP